MDLVKRAEELFPGENRGKEKMAYVLEQASEKYGEGKKYINLSWIKGAVEVILSLPSKKGVKK